MHHAKHHCIGEYVCNTWWQSYISLLIIIFPNSFVQEVARQHLLTQSVQQVLWMQWVEHAGRASCRAVAAAGRLDPKSFPETGSGEVVETTSTMATASARSLWMPVNEKRPMRKPPWRAHGFWWTSITTKQDGGWGFAFMDFSLYILRLLVKYVFVMHWNMYICKTRLATKWFGNVLYQYLMELDAIVESYQRTDFQKRLE